jgi:hypothetical protein
MRIVAFALLCAASAIAQTQDGDLGLLIGKPVEVDLNKMLEAINAASHVHTVPYECQGKPDQVYARLGSVYYACLSGKDVCSLEKGVNIPYSLIENLQEGRPPVVTRAVMDAKVARVPAVTVSRVTAADLASAAPRPPVSDDDVRSLAVGASRFEVREKLGNPQMKITGDVETYLYRLASGNSAQIEFAAGKLTKVRLIRNN